MPKSRGAGYPFPKPPCLSFPSARMDRQKGHAHAPDVCVRANTSGAVRVLCVLHTVRVAGRCMHMHACECASMCERAHPRQPQQQQICGQISVFPHAGPRAIMCTLAWVCTRVCKPLFPGHLLPQGHSLVPRQPPGLVPPYEGAGCTGLGVYTHTHMRVHRHVVTHPAAVGKAPPGRGLPRHSCWVTARPNDAMSSFAYAKQHLCCGVPREEASTPAPRDPAQMPGVANASPTHVPPTPPWPHTLAWACFINSNYPR